MTASPQLIGLAAGLVAAVLFTSLGTSAGLAIALFFLTPLPILLAGIGWGVLAAQLAFMTATVLVGVFGSFKLAVVFVLSVGLPDYIITHLVHLRRTVTVPQTATGPAQGDVSIVEWYPLGRIIAWVALMSGFLIALAIGLSGDAAQYKQSVKTLFDAYTAQAALDPARSAAVLDAFGRFILPASLGMTWLLIILGNAWLAAKSVAISGLLERPWPSFARLEYPMPLMVAFLGAVALGMLPNQVGVMAMGFVGAFSLAYLILGLSVVHTVVPETSVKPIILAGIYMGLFIAGWIFIPVLVLLGLGESVLELRRRALERSTPPQ